MPGSTEYGTAPAPWLNHAQAGQSAHVGGSQAPDAGVAGAAGSHLARTPLQPQSGQQQQQQQQQQQESSKKKKRRTDGDNIDEKRTKTGRACDACRSKKIRCDILPTEASGEAPPMCAHCKQYSIECTFFLPITETRFKKRRPAPDDAASAPSPNTNGAAAKLDKPTAPTSIPFLLHATVPSRQFEQFDISNHAHWELSEDNEGRIIVEATLDTEDSEHASRLEKYVLPGPVMSALVNKYFEHDNTLLPVISREDFLANSSPNPFLLYCICALSSVSRDYPRHVFHRLRSLVNGLIRCNEILSHPKMEYIQGLLIIGLTGEIHAQPTSPTASTAVIRDGVAIRMAQDLGLHREPKAKPTTPAQLAAAESRRRVWAVCVFIDRWLQNGLDMPQIIDIHDCNILVPSPRQIVPGVEPEKWPINNHYLGLGENLKLALISGRIVKLMYGPSELTNVTDEQLESALAELNDWRTNIPKVLQFAGPESPFLNGFLHIQFSAVSFLFWRCFLRVKQPVPSHIKLVLDTNRWAELVQWSRESIEWLNLHDRTLDTLFVLPYSATSCALIQYHTWARRRDPAALETLKLVCDVVERWEAAVKPDQMSIRKKSCETMMLLYEAALKTTQEDDRTDRSDGTPTSSTTGPRSVAAEPGSSSAPTPAFPTRRAQPTTELYTSGEGPSLVEYDHQPEHIPMFEDATELDMSFLDSIPESNFDWSGWGQYFETVDRMFPTTQGEDSDMT